MLNLLLTGSRALPLAKFTLPQAANLECMGTSTLLQKLNKENDSFVVQIGKKNQTLFNRSLWIGNRVGGMGSWLSALQYHLPYKNFYLYVESADEPTLDYFDTYFKRAFYKTYMGICTGPREQIPSDHLHQVQSVVADSLLETMEQAPKTYLVDVRTQEQIKKAPVVGLPDTFEYCNIALGDEQLGDRFSQTFRKFNPETEQIITMCARGYRATIAYSLFRHLLKYPQASMHACQSTVQEINGALESGSMKKKRASIHA